MATKIMLGTNNKDKIKEIKYLLNDNDNDNGYNIITPMDLALSSPAETGNTFFENAQIKAHYYGEKMQLPVIAEDSGLCVDALNGAPGIETAQWALQAGSIAKFFENIRDKIIGIKTSRASFNTCFIYYNPISKELKTATAILEGNLDFTNINQETFGFDSFFIPLGYDVPLSLLTFEEKMEVTPRKKALTNLLEQLG